MTIVDPSFSTFDRHASVLTPSMFIAHDPQIPSRHELRVAQCGNAAQGRKK